MTKLLFLDCDSTLSAIEGVDELAGRRNAETFADCKKLTDMAMDGEISIGSVFGRRLEVIRPTRQDCEEIARDYITRIEPTARETVTAAKAAGWTVIILSGGFVPVIRPLAEWLGIAHIEAVDLHFTEDGSYAGYVETFPTTRNGGKSEVIERWKTLHPAALTVMVGDGVSDLEARNVADRFIGFGGFVERAAVRQGADFYVTSLREILPLLPV